MTTKQIREELKSLGISAIVRLVNNRFEIRVKKQENFATVVKMFPLSTVTYSSFK